MINVDTMNAAPFTDEELVSRALAGDRDAFNHIVARYQVLICSLAYSRTGQLGLSEDVAQETFIAAWKQLSLLREPAKLRAWLCAIVRNRIHNRLQRESREPAHHAEPLEAVDHAPALDAPPCEQTISREEEAILWRSLEKIPELYREPLILYYRQHQSIQSVAAALDLTEDAVKQRLSRGRNLLRDEVQSFVESTLRRTVPGETFSGAVLAAIPGASAALAGTGLAGKGVAAAKTGFLGVLFLPFIGIACGIGSQWLAISSNTSGSQCVKKIIPIIAFWICMLTWCIGGENLLFYWRPHQQWSDSTFYLAFTLFWWVTATAMCTLNIVVARQKLAEYQRLESAVGATIPTPIKNSLGIVAGEYIALFSWLIALALRAHDNVTAGIALVAMLGLGAWHLSRLRNRTGSETMRAGSKPLAAAMAVILAILNLRLYPWLAASRGTTLSKVNEVLPLWVIPALTLLLVAWCAFLARRFKPSR